MKKIKLFNILNTKKNIAFIALIIFALVFILGKDYISEVIKPHSLTGANLSRVDLSNTDLTGVNLSGVDLSNTDLTGTTLTKSNLTGVNLSGVDLSNTDLTGANLSGVDLSNKNLSGTILRDVNLTGANLDGVDLRNMNLIGANLSGVDLSNKDLTGTTLTESNLTGVNLSGVDLRNMNLTGVNLSGVDLSNKDLTGTTLTESNLTGVNLDGVDLRNMNLTGTNLSGANFRLANLSGVDLRNMNLTGVNLDGVDLRNMNLTGVNLSGVDLSNKDLTGTTLTDVNLTGVNLDGVDLRNMNLTGVNLSGIDLSNKDLTGANLSGVDLSDKNLSGTILRDVNLSGVNLIRVDLSNKDLTGTTLTESNLKGVNLDGVDLSNVDLTGAMLATLNSGGEFRVNIKNPSNSNWPTLNEIQNLNVTKYDLSRDVQYISTREGFLFELNNNESRLVLDLNNDANSPFYCCSGETGFFSVASQNKLVYVSYSSQDSNGMNSLVVDEYSMNFSKVRNILKFERPGEAHFGGNLLLDSLGKLYLSVGDSSARFEAQNLNTLNGKILRLDVSDLKLAPEIIAYGIRNPWGVTIDAKDRMFVMQCGWQNAEAVYLLNDLYSGIPANFGWPIFQGTTKMSELPNHSQKTYQMLNSSQLMLKDLVAPIFETTKRPGCLTAGVYLEDIESLLFGDYYGFIRLLKQQDNGEWLFLHEQKEGTNFWGFGLDKKTNKVFAAPMGLELEISVDQVKYAQ